MWMLPLIPFGGSYFVHHADHLHVASMLHFHAVILFVSLFGLYIAF